MFHFKDMLKQAFLMGQNKGLLFFFHLTLLNSNLTDWQT